MSKRKCQMKTILTYPSKLRLDLVLFLLVKSIPVGVKGLTLAAGWLTSLFSFLSKNGWISKWGKCKSVSELKKKHTWWFVEQRPHPVSVWDRCGQHRSHSHGRTVFQQSFGCCWRVKQSEGSNSTVRWRHGLPASSAAPDESWLTRTGNPDCHSKTFITSGRIQPVGWCVVAWNRVCDARRPTRFMQILFVTEWEFQSLCDATAVVVFHFNITIHHHWKRQCCVEDVQMRHLINEHHRKTKK